MELLFVAALAAVDVYLAISNHEKRKEITQMNEENRKALEELKNSQKAE